MNYVIINDKIINTVPAITEEEHMRGLMYVDKVPESMSFLFNKSAIHKFWMNNTKVPLDIVFCHNDRIIDICKGEPYSRRFVGPNKYSNLVIEFPQGYCKENSICVGNKVRVKLSINKLAAFFESKLESG